MALDAGRLFRPEIPGENLTVDSRSYPWRNPPKYPEFDDAFEYVVDEKLSNQEALAGAMILMSQGMSALGAVQMMLITMVSKGDITPDMSLMLSGPVYKTFTRLMDAANVKYLSGFDTPDEVRAFAEYMKSDAQFDTSGSAPKLSEEQEDEMERITEEVKEQLPTGGLMGAPTDGEESVDIPVDEETSTSLVTAPEAEEMQEEDK